MTDDRLAAHRKSMRVYVYVGAVLGVVAAVLYLALVGPPQG